MPFALLILGGTRSGKSRFAVARQPTRGRVAFVATATASDADMSARIRRHREERPRHWLTVEEPLELVRALEGLVDRVDAVVVDCVTLWVANRLLRGDPDAVVLDAVEALGALICRRPYDLTLVSNEVGAGVHPPTADGLRFADLLGLVNQRLAAACDQVTLLVAGLPLTVKTGGPRHEPSVQAP